MAQNPNLPKSGLETPFSQEQFSQDLRLISSPVQPDDELLNTLITSLSGAAKDAGLAAQQKFRGPNFWLKDRLAVANRGKLRRDDFTNGLSVADEVEQSKFTAVAQQIDKDLDQLSRMRQENVQAYLEAVKGILKTSPDHPAIAALARPNKDQMGLAIALSLIAPNSAGAIAQSLAQNQISQQQQQQQVNDLDFEAQLRQIDQNLGLAKEEFSAQDKILSDQQSIAATVKENEKNREIDKLKADTQRTNILNQVFNGIRADIDQIGDSSPATVAYLLNNRTASMGIQLTDEERQAIISDVSSLTERKARGDEAKIEKDLATTASIQAGTLLTQEKTVAQQNANTLFSDTYQAQVDTIQNRATGLGLDNEFKTLRNKKLEIELPYVEKQILQDLAESQAHLDYYKVLTKNAANKGVAKSFDLEIDFAEDDLKAAQKKFEDMDKAAEAATNVYRSAETAFKQGIPKDDGTPLVTARDLEVLTAKMNQTGLAAMRQKKTVEDLKNTIREMHVKQRRNEEVQAADPMAIDPSLKGKIGN